ncbi:MAG: GNAT family N-acetyltransferase [Leptospirales bacterium]|nr:GNAT family N-acetyltransferase [Leptospirales bacterium]
MLKIYPLHEKKSVYPILAYWSYLHWFIHRDISFRLIMHEYKKRALSDELPCSFVAFWNEFPVGMVSLRKIDLQSREDLTPWLSALYVLPDYRNRGIGSELINAVLNSSQEKGFRRIFLFLDNRGIIELEKYYSARGWIYLDDSSDSEGNNTKILFHEL